MTTAIYFNEMSTQ